jgi:hypothetical protein
MDDFSFSTQRSKSPKKFVINPVSALILVGLIGLTGCISSTSTTPSTDTNPQTNSPINSDATVSQANASRSAKAYLDFSGFSRSGLIKQLMFEGYSESDASYGADAQNANWNEQAARSAKAYLDFSGFSRSGLIKQLIFEGYSKQEAEFGASANGL